MNEFEKEKQDRQTRALMTRSEFALLGDGVVYAVTLAKGAASLQRSIGTHLLVRPSEDKRIFQQQVTAFTSYAYLENIAVQEYVSGGTEADAARLESVMAQKTEEGKKQAAEAAAKKIAAAAATQEVTALERKLSALYQEAAKN